MKKAYVFLAAIGLTCLGSNASFAQQQEYTSQQLETLKQAATQGDVASQENLGQIYQFGKFGVKKNLFTARDWYEKAAAQGYGNAYNNIGILYQDGLGVHKTKSAALDNFKQACLNDSHQGCENYKKFEKQDSKK